MVENEMLTQIYICCHTNCVSVCKFMYWTVKNVLFYVLWCEDVGIVYPNDAISITMYENFRSIHTYLLGDN